MGSDQGNQKPSDDSKQESNQNEKEQEQKEEEEQGEVDVTDSINKLLKYVERKSDESPDDSVLGRIEKKLGEVSESLKAKPPEQQKQEEHKDKTPKTPDVQVPGFVTKYIRKRGGRIVARSVPVKEGGSKA